MGAVITIAQRKGGAGKTTLACQLAAAFAAKGLSVIGLDTDDQRSFTRWAAARRATLKGRDRFQLEAGADFGFPSVVRRARESADVVIVDTPPTADLCAERAIRAADLVIAPLQLSPIDLDAALPTAALIGRWSKDALFVINRTPPRARIADLIREKIGKHALPVARSELGNRAAFAESMLQGLGVVESAPTTTAAEEIAALYGEIAGKLALGRRAA